MRPVVITAHDVCAGSPSWCGTIGPLAGDGCRITAWASLSRSVRVPGAAAVNRELPTFLRGPARVGAVA